MTLLARSAAISKACRIALACGLAFGCSTISLHAEQSRNDPGRSHPAHNTDGTLRGPKVKDRNVPGQSGSFGSGDELRKHMADRLPPRAIHRVLTETLGPDAPEATRATPEQMEKVQGIVNDFEDQLRSYMDQHKDEIRDLRSKTGPMHNRTAEKPDDMREEPKTDEQRAEREKARERIKQIMDGAPKVEDTLTKIWVELQPAQQKAVQDRLDEVRKDMSEHRKDEFVKRRADQRSTDGPDARPPRPGDEHTGISPERRERFLHLIEQLPPQAQDELLERLEHRIREMKERRESGGKDGPGPEDARGKHRPDTDGPPNDDRRPERRRNSRPDPQHAPSHRRE